MNVLSIAAALVLGTSAAPEDPCVADARAVLETFHPYRAERVGWEAMAGLFGASETSVLEIRAEAFLEELEGFRPASADEFPAGLCQLLGGENVATLRRSLSTGGVHAFAAHWRRTIASGLGPRQVRAVAERTESDRLVFAMLPTDRAHSLVNRKIMDLLSPRWSQVIAVQLRGRWIQGGAAVFVKAAAGALSSKQRSEVADAFESAPWSRYFAWAAQRRLAYVSGLLTRAQAKLETDYPTGEKALRECVHVLAERDPAEELFWGYYLESCSELFVFGGMYQLAEAVAVVEPEDRWTILAAGLQFGLCEPTGLNDPFCQLEPTWMNVAQSKALARPLLARHFRTVHGEELGGKLERAFWSRTQLLFPAPAEDASAPDAGR